MWPSSTRSECGPGGGRDARGGGPRLAAGLALLAVVLTGPAQPTPAPARTLLASTPRTLADFALTNAEGRTVRLSDLRGAPVLVFFGFAHCPTVCPAALTQLRLLELNHSRDLGGARIVVISVDGERDTPAMLSEWLKPISPTFIGLTGPTSAVRDIATQFSAAFFKGAADAAGDYLVEHNSQIFLLDAQGRLRATFFDAPPETLAQVTKRIAGELP